MDSKHIVLDAVDRPSVPPTILIMSVEGHGLQVQHQAENRGLYAG